MHFDMQRAWANTDKGTNEGLAFPKMEKKLMNPNPQTPVFTLLFQFYINFKEG